MNILFISFGLDPTVGGTERVTRTLMKGFEQQGINCFITFCTGDDATFPSDKKLKVDYRSSYSDYKKSMDEYIERHHIDLIINENVCEWNVSRLFRELKAKRKDIPIIYCLHNTPDLFVPHYSKINAQSVKNLVYRFFTGDTIYMAKHRRMYEIADRYVVLSPSYIQRFCEVFKLKDEGKVIAIPNPITMTATGDCTEDKENIFLVVARLSEKQKNISAILRIWKEFSKQDSGYRLQIVGYGPDETMLQNYAKTLDLRNVEFVGKTSEPQKYYRRAKFFLMTSRYEGFPMTIIEAMQFGCIPIVYNSFSAINDIVADGENGILVSNGDEASFLTAMYRIATDENRQEKIRENLRPSLGKYSIEAIEALWFSLFNRLKEIINKITSKQDLN